MPLYRGFFVLPGGQRTELANEVGEVIMRREWAMPSADTFDIPPIAAFVKKYLRESKVSVDPFARNKRWATYTNDLNPDTQADYHMEAAEFLKEMERNRVRPDVALFDPPYSLQQAMEVYAGVGREFMQKDAQTVGRWTEHRDIMAGIMSDDAAVLSFGWNSIGMGRKHGFELVELLIVCHGGAHNDTICIAERRVQPRLKF